ncbi:MAG: PP2C family protein-serine/threonine phosphatase [Desulfovibrionaceae bacterium]
MDAPPLILVVDDEPVNAAVLKGMLEFAGYAVRVARYGEQGRELARAEHPALILLDVMMPQESGFETCAKLKVDPATADIPVIFLTCLDDVSNKINGLGLGAVDYVTKPFHADEVLARVQAQLKVRERQERIIRAQADRLGQVKNAQRRMLVAPADVPGARFGVRYVPVLEAGGDFYDVLDLGDGVMGYFVADVSGHDLGAGFVTSSLKALLRQNAAADRDPAAVLAAMNRVLRDITPPELYLTAVYARLDRGEGLLTVAGAGHPPALLCLDGGAGPLDLPGDVLGMFETVELGRRELDVRPGDRLFLYSDGLLESAPGRLGSVAGNLDRLARAGEASADLPIAEAVEAMAETLLGATSPADDVVLLGVEI